MEFLLKCQVGIHSSLVRVGVDNVPLAIGKNSNITHVFTLVVWSTLVESRPDFIGWDHHMLWKILNYHAQAVVTVSVTVNCHV